jgi:phosphatidylinositol alpha-1,6-mannosyltransferase
MKTSVSVFAIVTDAFGGRGGIAQYNRDFFGALAQADAVSSITIVPRLAPDPPILPVKTEQAKPLLGRIVYSVAAIRMALERRVDIVFCGHLYMAPLAVVIKRLKRAKLIIQTHGIEAWPRPSEAQRRAVEAADLVLCVSRYTRSALLSWANIEPERVFVLPNTVREVFTAGDRASIRSKLGLEGKNVLLTVGRMDARQRYKGQDLVIKMIPALLEQGFDIQYLIAGEGDDRSRLEAFASEVGVSKRVRFLGEISVNDLVDTYRAADLFVMPSTGEGFGIAYLEAMASGTSAIGHKCGGATDALADGELGTLASEDDLAVAVVSLLSQPIDSKKLACAVHSRFGRERFIAGVNAALNRVTEVV